jgi:hypothetical protein
VYVADLHLWHLIHNHSTIVISSLQNNTRAPPHDLTLPVQT